MNFMNNLIKMDGNSINVKMVLHYSLKFSNKKNKLLLEYKVNLIYVYKTF